MNKKYKINLHGKEIEIEQLPNGKFKKPDFIAKQKGCHSSVAPLKQTTEIWNIYRKPFKTGTVTRDILAYEDGDSEVTISGLNIDAGRVPINSEDKNLRLNAKNHKHNYSNPTSISLHKSIEAEIKNCDMGRHNSQGRYPAQLFLDGAISYTREEIDLDNADFLEFIGIDSDVIKFMETEKALDYVCQHIDKFDVSKLLDEQSGVLTSGTLKGNYKGGKGKLCYGDYSDNLVEKNYSSNSGGCSRILHNASFVLQELYQHIYYSKPSNYERNSLISDIEIKEKEYSHDGRDKHIENPYQRHDSKAQNNHPTLKSLKLIWEILKLFTTVDTEKMKVLIPFSGVFSEKIAFLAHEYKDENITTIEISEDYYEIGKAREKFWIENDFFFKDTKKVYDEKRKKAEENTVKTKRMF